MADCNFNLQKYLQEFLQMWSHGQRAHLQVQCSNGRAWVNLSTDLGPWRHLLPNFRKYPRPRRPQTTPTPSPKPPGKPTPPSTNPPPPPSSPSPSLSTAPPTVTPPLPKHHRRRQRYLPPEHPPLPKPNPSGLRESGQTLTQSARRKHYLMTKPGPI